MEDLLILNTGEVSLSKTFKLANDVIEGRRVTYTFAVLKDWLAADNSAKIDL